MIQSIATLAEAKNELRSDNQMIIINNTEQKNHKQKRWYISVKSSHCPTPGPSFWYINGSIYTVLIQEKALNVKKRDFLLDQLSQNFFLYLTQELRSESSQQDISHLDTMFCSLYQYLYNRIREINRHNESGDKGITPYMINKIRNYINQNIEKAITTKDIASIPNLSLYHFCRSFKKTTTMTPKQYIIKMKIDRAKNLLLKKDTNIIQVGLMTGFENHSHFSNVFKKYVGTSPRDYRRISSM